MADYQEQFCNVLDYIDANLGGNLSVELLSQVAHLSKFHFHRQFSSHFGMGISAYIKQLRIRRASYQLAFRKTKVIEIALDNGYESSEAFSRAFKQNIGQSPTNFRKNPDWTPWHEKHQPLTKLRDRTKMTWHKLSAKVPKTEHFADRMPSNFEPTLRSFNMQCQNLNVEIIKFDEVKLAVMEHRGPPNQLKNTIRKFIEWRRENRLSPDKYRTFNLVYENYRLDLCTSIQSEVFNDNAVISKVIPAGRCAVTRHMGSDDTIDTTIRYLYLDWLNKNGEELRDFPLFFERIRFFPDVPEHEMVTDVYLPLT